jgi:hypothetical protein
MTTFQKLLAVGTDENTAVEIVSKLKMGYFPRGLSVRQAIAIGWL